MGGDPGKGLRDSASGKHQFGELGEEDELIELCIRARLQNFADAAELTAEQSKMMSDQFAADLQNGELMRLVSPVIIRAALNMAEQMSANGSR